MHEEPILSEQEHRDLRNLLNKNISMDFILEMREAFQLFDKVYHKTSICILQDFFSPVLSRRRL